MKKSKSYIGYWCNQILDLTEEKYAVVEFGLIMVRDSLIKTAGILLTGALWGRFWEFAVALGAFSGLRYWAGGRHCKTNIGCFCVMNAVCGGAVMGASLLTAVKFPIIYTGLLVVIFILAVWAPYQLKNLTIKKEKYKQSKKVGACVFVIIMGILIALIRSCFIGRIIVIAMLFELMSILPFKGKCT